jgi:hypothetical protein
MLRAMAVALASLLAAAAVLPGAGEPATARAVEPWRGVIDDLRETNATIVADLESARAALRERARGDREATRLLTPEPVRLRSPGYGVLPEIIADSPPAAVSPTEKTYSLERLTADVATAAREAGTLAGAAARPDRPLLPLIKELDRVQERLRNLEDHVGYHAYWQGAVTEYPDYFAHFNEIVAQVRAMESLRAQGTDPGRVEELRREILLAFAALRKTPGLRIERRAGGWLALPVTVTTDISNDGFLAAFREGVEAAFVDAPAARERRFRLELTLRRLHAAELYPEGPPRRGDPIDAAAHVARFPEGALVLTTGEASTNAWPGRSVVLGPADVTRRTLAHEFAHLLGFQDAYLRGFDTASDPRFGVVLVEWTGLRDDLMGNAKSGVLTPDMVQTLIDAYLPR